MPPQSFWERSFDTVSLEWIPDSLLSGQVCITSIKGFLVLLWIKAGNLSIGWVVRYLFPSCFQRSFLQVLSEAREHFGKIHGSTTSTICMITNQFCRWFCHLVLCMLVCTLLKSITWPLICYFSSYFCLCMLQENDSGTLDTVGAVVVDQEGNVAAAVSSGGLALKHPGRVGQVIIRFHLGMPVQ